MVLAYYNQDEITIHHALYSEILPALPRVDHVITDPPYNLRGDDIPLPGRTPMRRDFGAWDEGWDPSEFLHQMAGWVRPGGSLLAFTSDRLVGKFRDGGPGWRARGTLVWVKSNPAPTPAPSYVQASELIVWLQRIGAAATWNGSGYVPNVLSYPVCAGDERTAHPTQKPEALIADLITRHTNPGDLILDPFMGSGTVLVAAKRLGRRAIGIDCHRPYCESAIRRLAQGALPLYDTADGGPVDQVLDLERIANA